MSQQKIVFLNQKLKKIKKNLSMPAKKETFQDKNKRNGISSL